MRKRTKVLLALAFAAAALWAGNTSLFSQSDVRPRLIAHRGLGQTFHREGLTGETCTATRIFPPEHAYLENTIAGFRAAFIAGADVVEFDIHPTTDGRFVVFHDWTLDCRTDGHGVTREHDLATLKALDIGYGYTADGGKTFPFRGKGVGLMPSLDEILATFPDERFLINVKSNDEEEGKRLAAVVGALPDARRKLITVYGGGGAMDSYAAALPDAGVLDTDGVKRCLLRYWVLGWSGYLPRDCRDTLFMLPANIAPFVWGSPDRLAARLKAVNSTVVLLGAYDGSGFSSGIDDIEALPALPKRFDGAIWTNRIDRIGPAVKQ